jgi:YaiO family outer membrane protein
MIDTERRARVTGPDTAGGRRRAARGLRAAVAAAFVLGAASLGAQRPTPAARVDVIGTTQNVTNGFGDWNGVAVRGLARPSLTMTWYGEFISQKAFGDQAVYGSVANLHSLGRSWYGFLGVGGGSGDFVFPDLRVDYTLSRKWGASQRFITNVGGTFVDAKNGYRDLAGTASVTTYLTDAAVLELGGRYNRSTRSGGDDGVDTPAVGAGRAFGALTLGTEGSQYLVVRGSTGREGWQIISPTVTLRKFDSHEASVSWRRWIGSRGGFLIQGDYYRNDIYTRSGVSLGLFGQW